MRASVCSRRAARPIMRYISRRLLAQRGSSSIGKILTSCRQSVPLVARVYPNGSGDVNHFHAAGGMGFVIRELLDAGLLHRDIMTVAADDLTAYGQEPVLDGEALAWRDAPAVTADETMLRPPSNPFSPDGGMRLVTGNLGRATFKTSAVDPARWTIEAPVRVFHRSE